MVEGEKEGKIRINGRKIEKKDEGVEIKKEGENEIVVEIKKK